MFFGIWGEDLFLLVIIFFIVGVGALGILIDRLLKMVSLKIDKLNKFVLGLILD